MNLFPYFQIFRGFFLIVNFKSGVISRIVGQVQSVQGEWGTLNPLDEML